MWRFVVLTTAVIVPLAARASGVPHLTYGEFCVDPSGTKVWFNESSDPIGGPGLFRSVALDSGQVSSSDGTGLSSPPPGCTALRAVRLNDIGVTTRLRWGTPEPEIPNPEIEVRTGDTEELEIICPATLAFLRGKRVVGSTAVRLRCRTGDDPVRSLGSVTPLGLTAWAVPGRNVAVVVVNPKPQAYDAFEQLVFLLETTAPSEAALRRPARYQHDIIIAPWPIYDLAQVSLRIGEELSSKKQYLLAARWFALAASSAADRSSQAAAWNIARSHDARFKRARALALAARFDDAFLELSTLAEARAGLEARLRDDQVFVPMHADPRWNALLLGMH